MSQKNFLFFVIGSIFSICAFFLSFNFTQAAPYVTVNYPNGGECFTPGTPITVSWTGAEFDHVAIAYRAESDGAPTAWSSNSTAWNIVHNPGTNVFSYIWNTSSVSTGIPYKIWIEGHNASHQTVAIADSSNYSFGFASSCGTSSSSDTVLPTSPTASASPYSSSSITVSWSGATDNVGVTGYKIYRNSTYLTYTTGLSYTDSGLSSSTSYSYYVVAYDLAGNMSLNSNTATAATLSSTNTSTDTTAPVISGVATQNIIGSGAQIIWTTDDASTSKVWYSSTPNSFIFLSENRCDGGGYIISHCVNLMDLSLSTSYYFKVESANSNNYVTQSTGQQFTSAISTGSNTTSSSSDTVLPTSPTASASPYSSSSITVSWSGATDNVGVTGYKIYRNSTYLTYTTGLSYTDSGLSSSTSYSYYVVAYDLAGNMSLNSNTATAATLSSTNTSTDTTAPGIPISYANPLSSTSINISWSAVSDNIGVVGYKIYKNGIYLTTTALLFYTDTGLTSSTVYSYTVSAYDAAGNVSSQSAYTSATTYNSDTISINYAKLSGQVTNISGNAVSGVNVYVYSTTNNYYSSLTDTYGNYSISGVYPGTYSVYVYQSSNSSYNSLSNSITLTESQTAVLNFQFKDLTKIIKGKVSFSDNTPVNDAKVSAYNSSSGVWADGSTDILGNYQIKVSGGKWQLSVYKNTLAGNYSNNWSYSELSREVVFTENDSAEESIVNFAVQSSSVPVKGKVVKTDGSAPALGVVSIILKDSSGYSYYSSPDSTGSFSVSLPAGVYTGQVFSNNSAFSTINISAFSVSGITYDLGQIYLVSNSEKIKGKVSDSNGIGISGALVNASENQKNQFVQTKTSTDGSYELIVSSGQWDVYAYTDSSLGYISNQSSKKITVSQGATAEENFIFELADSQISGNIIDENGQIIVDVNGSVSTYQSGVSLISSSNYYPFGGSIVNGSFSFKANHGTYTLNVYLPSDSKYAAPNSQTITIAKGEAKKINFSIIKNNSSIAGFIKDNLGNIITGLGNDKIKIYVSSHSGAWYNAQVDSLKGTYNISVAPGTWYMGYWVDQSSGYSSLSQDIEIVISAGQIKNIDVVLNKSDGYIAGVTKTSDGKPLANVWVSVENKNFSGTTSTTSLTKDYSGSTFIAGINSDINGVFKVAVPAGVYYVHSYYPLSFGYINSAEVKIEILSGQTINTDLIFNKPEIKISGYTIIEGKKITSFVWAWEDLGGYAQARSDENGFYSLNVSKNGKWHISASADINNVFYKASEIDAATGNQNISEDLVLLPIVSTVKSFEKIVEATKSQSAELSDGAKIILPANSTSTSGNINVSLKPSIETPSFGNSSVVGSSYNVEVRDSNGQKISNLNSEITISLPYDDNELAGRGVKPENLSLSFFDETADVWKPLEKQVVDKTNKVVSGVVNHLTIFVLVSPADVLPPPAPINIKAKKNNSEIVLSWINPTSDFHNIKIYRSEKKNELGNVVYNYINTASQSDKISDDKTYFYTVRSVDLSGNESVNILQVTASIVSSGTESKSNLSFTKKLVLGSKNEEVVKLQELLNNLGYNSGKADGKFGKMTQKGLKQFQTANGLKADGVAGPKTRKKLNEALSSSGISFCPQPLKNYGDLSLTNLERSTGGLPADYIPAELTPIDSIIKTSKSICLTSEAAQSLKEMYLAAQNNGLELMVNSGYRSFDYQKEIYNSWLKNNNANDSDTVAKSGYSEHQLGTTVDLTGKDIKFKPTDFFFGNSDEGKWLQNNAYKYGFVLSYPDGKSGITGYKYEPWHYRFVGEKIALEIVKNGLTPLEYFKIIGKFAVKQ